MDGCAVPVEDHFIEINRERDILGLLNSDSAAGGVAMEINHVVGGDTFLHLNFARFMDVSIELVRQVFDDEIVQRFERNYDVFLSTFSPAGPAFCIDNFVDEEIESRNRKKIASRSPTAKVPALGYYLRKDLLRFNETEIGVLKWWIGYIFAASYLGSAVFIDAPVKRQAIRSPEELARIWGPAAYLFSPYDLGFTDEPTFFKLVALTISDAFFEFLKSKGVSAKRKLKAMLGCYVMAGHMLRRLDVCEPGAEPLAVIMQANLYDQVREEPEVERYPGCAFASKLDKKPWYSDLP